MPKPARKPPPVPPPLERDVQRTAMTLIATSWPWLRVIRMNSGRGRHWAKLAPKGTPDLLVLMPRGQVLWIEMKRLGCTKRDDDTRKAQIAWAAHATGELGHTVVVCETADAALAAVRMALYVA